MHWHLRELRRFNDVFTLLQLVYRVHQLPTRINQTCCYKDDEVPLHVLFRVRPEETSHDRNIANDGGAILCLLHILTHQTAENNRLAIPDAHARGHLTSAEDRLVNDVRGEDAVLLRDRRKQGAGETWRSQDGAAVVNEAFEFYDLWDEIKVDRDPIRAHYRFDLQGYASVPRLEGGRRCRSHRHGSGRPYR